MANTDNRSDLSGRRILIMATDGFEQSELFEPLEQLRALGATVEIASLESGDIKGWDKDDWGKTVGVDHLIASIDVEDYDALVLPGGQINPDVLRKEDEAIALIQDFADADKTVAAICHAPWLLIEAELVEDRTITGYESIRTDLINAGADFVDEEVAIDENIITSRNPGDLPAFISAIAKAVSEQPALEDIEA